MVAPVLLALAPVITKMVSGLIDKFIPDTEGRDKAKAELSAAIIENAADMEKAAASVVLAEVKSENWLASSWRPLIMVWFAVLLGMDWFGYRPEYMTPDQIDGIYKLLQIGIGGYIGGRSAEKMVKAWKKK